VAYHREQLPQVGGSEDHDTASSVGDRARVIKGVRHDTKPVVGIMWHPERLPPQPVAEDRRLIQAQFGGQL
jgi:anthranilate/para-aminobenzoate synthase component II